MSIYRVFVSKKKEFASEGKRLAHVFQEELDLPVRAVTVYERYDVEGLAPDDQAKALEIFAEHPVDDIFEDIPVASGQHLFGREFLPGQYDQRADSAQQCLTLVTMKNGYRVRCARFLLIDGDLTAEELQKIKDYYINPVDSQEATLAMPDTLAMDATPVTSIPIVEGLVEATPKDLQAIKETWGLAMSLADLSVIQAHFQSIHRNPTEAELRVLDTYWSDHCRHTTFATTLSPITIEEGPYTSPIEAALTAYRIGRQHIYGPTSPDKPETLMDMATLAMKELKKDGKLEALDASDEINACTVVVPVTINGKEEEWLLLFKNETHNHPTEIEPFGGAATCLGGCIRDPLSGRAYVYQAMRITGAADPRHAITDTLPGKLPQRVITQEAARGYSSYGNQIGLATGEVKEYYHPGFMAKRMEVGAVIGAVPRSAVRREKPVPGDIVLLVGGDTGRDGCGGATGSSKEHTESSLANCGTEVQKGNALTERKIQRLFRNPQVTTLIKRCNDFGAGGVSVAIGELADSLLIDLDAVPKKYDGLTGTELAISESQERMAVVIAPDKLSEFLSYCDAENVNATKVATVTDSGALQMLWRGQTIVDLDRVFLDSNGACSTHTVTIQSPDGDYFTSKKSNDIITTWLDTLAQLNITSQQGLSERFDATVGSHTVLLPFGGTYQKTPVQGMVAKLPVLEGETTTASIMTHGYDPYLASWSPFHGAQYAILSAVAKNIALGGRREAMYLSLQEYFEKLGNRPEAWGKPVSALLGAYVAQKELSIAAIGGKDSMSGTFMDQHVPPSLLAFAVSTADTSRIVSPEFKEPGHKLCLLHLPRHADDTPNWDVFKEHCHQLEFAMDFSMIHAAYALGTGGIAEAITKMALGNRIGATLDSKVIPHLFDVAHGSFLIEVDELVAETISQYDYISTIGETTADPKVVVGPYEMSLQLMETIYEKTLSPIFPLEGEDGTGEAVVYIHDRHTPARKGTSIARPKVIIPVFPGTNCEYDSAKAFERAGGCPEIFVIRNRSLEELEESVTLLQKKIASAQIVMFPGGFSAGDEPDGSGKYMATFFRNPYMAEALEDLLYQRDGLVLGICNGFQTLIKLGLLPTGHISPITEESPTLTYNAIGRHISKMVRTKVISVRSPWMSALNAGEIYTVPISHGEGRFIASPRQIIDYNRQGQIATQYVDEHGIASMAARYNPNQSMYAIEGLFSPDGRVFGKMAHVERVGQDVSKNINGEKVMPIFKSGIEYFK